MWAVRFLNGKRKGEIIPLQTGNYTFGRSEECQIVISESGLSKKHLELEIREEGVSVFDLRSSNGTFVNGIKIKEKNLRKGDKVSVSNITFDIIPSQEDPASPYPATYQGPAQPHMFPGQQVPPSTESMYPQDQAHAAHTVTPLPVNPDSPNALESGENLSLIKTLMKGLTSYMDRVVLAGVYKLPEWVEFKWVIAGFLLCFVLITTTLSAIPLIKILNSSIEQESMDHAETIATTLAHMNRESIQNQMYTATSVEYAKNRYKVKEALIIDTTGKIIAPPEKSQTHTQVHFFNKGRTLNHSSVAKIDPSTIAAIVPIQFYDEKLGAQNTHAYAAVLYKLGEVAASSEKTISLLVIVFAFSLLLGSLLFFFMYKIIEHPILSINAQLSSALKDDSLSVQTAYDFKPLQDLTDNINSTLSRISSAQDNQQPLIEYDRQIEMNHLIELIGYPTLGINMERMNIESVSAHFEEETGVSAERILHCQVDNLEDQALKLNIQTLLEKTQQHPHEIAYDSLEFSGVEFQLSAKGVYGKEGLAYTLITFIPTNQQEESE